MPDRIWDLFVELRKELMETQRIRAQVIGFKVAFVTTAVGVIATKIHNLDAILFVLPAFAAMLFDLLIYSYSFSIKRIGLYVRDHVEPALARHGHMPADFVQWQDYLTQPKTRQELAHYGNFGLTVLVVLIGGVALFFPFRPWVSLPLLTALIVLAAFDLAAYRSPRRLGKLWKEEGARL